MRENKSNLLLVFLLIIMILCSSCKTITREVILQETAKPVNDVVTAKDNSIVINYIPKKIIKGRKTLVKIKHTNNHIKNNRNQIIARRYYEIPVLSSENKCIDKINNFFENEEKSFLYGTKKSRHFSSNQHKSFETSVEEASKEYNLVKEPYYFTVNTKIMYQDAKIISFRQKTKWMAGGVKCIEYYGMTFDLATGKLLTLNNFVKNDVVNFNDVLYWKIREWLSKMGYEHKVKEIRKVFLKKDLCNYDFFYDGKAIYLIFNSEVSSNVGLCFKI